MPGWDRRVAVVLLVAAVVAGCSGGNDAETGATAPCDDAAFRGQDEELYVVQATISNAIGGGGDPATLLLDLQRGRAAIAGYLEAHPPCDERLVEIAQSEEDAVQELDDAIAAIEDGSDPAASLREALERLESAQRELGQDP